MHRGNFFISYQLWKEPACLPPLVGGGGSERGQNQPLSDKHNTLFPVNPVPAFSQILISNAAWEIVRG